MAALPYIQLYVADYLADTVHLSAEEHGAYLLLIMNYWQTGKPIPQYKLQSITKIPNERWTDVERALSEFFEICDDKIWHHSRIEDDLEKVLSKSTKASKAGKASAAKRAENKVIEIKEDSNERSTGNLCALNHTDTDTDKETDTDKIKTSRKTVVSPPYEQIVKIYHEYCPDNPRVEKLTTKRKTHIKSRWKNDLKELSQWENYFEDVASTPFLTGKSPPGADRSKPWIATFDWLINESNLVKVAEGNYKD